MTRLTPDGLTKAWLPLSSQHLMPELLKAITAPVKIIAVAGVQEGLRKGIGPSGAPLRPLAHPRPDGGNKPLLDKGLMAASVSAAVTQEGLELKASHPAANVHQFGATIRPHKQWLTLPMTAEAKRAGGARRFPRPLFFAPSKKADTAILAERTGQGSIRVQYVLKRQVRIPAREWLGFSPETLKRIEKLVADKAQEIIARAVEGKKGGTGTPGITGPGR